MTREQAHAIIPLLQAFADGKIIQTHLLGDAWADIGDTIFFQKPPTEYRIKPGPFYHQLSPKDIPPGSVLRPPSSDLWVAIQYVDYDSVYVRMDNLNESLGYKYLMEQGWKIKRPGEDWEPCYTTK